MKKKIESKITNRKAFQNARGSLKTGGKSEKPHKNRGIRLAISSPNKNSTKRGEGLMSADQGNRRTIGNKGFEYYV